jgi:hypothetical protein
MLLNDSPCQQMGIVSRSPSPTAQNQLPSTARIAHIDTNALRRTRMLAHRATHTHDDTRRTTGGRTWHTISWLCRSRYAAVTVPFCAQKVFHAGPCKGNPHSATHQYTCTRPTKGKHPEA